MVIFLVYRLRTKKAAGHPGTINAITEVADKMAKGEIEIKVHIQGTHGQFRAAVGVGMTGFCETVFRNLYTGIPEEPRIDFCSLLNTLNDKAETAQ